jgi:serine/threonine-protein kinase HipA
MPTKKYQNEGGPGVSDLFELLNVQSSMRKEDISSFLGAVGFNWLIAGTDAHAKNYSLLISGGPRVRLAPLYDLASILPYDDIDLHKVKLAMKVGGEYQLRQIGLRHWQKLAQDVRVDASELTDVFREMAQQLPDEVSRARTQAHDEGLDRKIIDRLAARLIERAEECQRLLTSAAT